MSKCKQCNKNEAGEGLCSENVDRSEDICLNCRQSNIRRSSKPTWDNLWICNCEYGWQNCKCDGKTGKKVR